MSKKSAASRWMIMEMGSKCCRYKKDEQAVTGKLHRNTVLLSDIGEILKKCTFTSLIFVDTTIFDY